MNNNDDPRGELSEGVQSSSNEIEQPKARIQDMQLEIDILREVLDVLKKRPRRRYDNSQEQGKSSDCRRLKNKYCHYFYRN